MPPSVSVAAQAPIEPGLSNAASLCCKTALHGHSVLFRAKGCVDCKIGLPSRTYSSTGVFFCASVLARACCFIRSTSSPADTIFYKPAHPRRRPLGVLRCLSALLTPAGCSQQSLLHKQVQDWPVRRRADTIGHAARMPASAAASKVAEKAPSKAAAPFAGLKLHPGALDPIHTSFPEMACAGLIWRAARSS